MGYTPVAVALGALAGTALGILLGRSILRVRTGPKSIKHVFLGRFKEGTSEEDLEKLVAGYCGLASQIKSMKAFEWGTNVSQEGLDKGFTHIFVTTFDDAEGVEYYLKHEEHVKYAQEILGHVADVVVVDYTPTVTK